jgi:hypothetical protein
MISHPQDIYYRGRESGVARLRFASPSRGSTATTEQPSDAPHPNYIDPLASFEYDDSEDDGCPNCGGEGFYADCVEEWACADPESGCALCTRKCDWCGGEG